MQHTNVITWQHLHMLDMRKGTLRLKYPRCTLIQEQLSPQRTLASAMRTCAIKLRRARGNKTVSVHDLCAHTTLENIPLDKMIRLLHLPRHPKKKKATLSVKDIERICRNIMQKLGGAQTEQTYELALCLELYKKGIPCMRQMPITTLYDTSTTIPAGIIDLEVDHRFLIELKSSVFSDKHTQQLARYLNALRSHGRQLECGLVVCFQPDNTVVFCMA